MSENTQSPSSSYFSHFEPVGSQDEETTCPPMSFQEELVSLLRQLAEGQDRQNVLLEEVVQQLGAAQRQRAFELNQWKKANPELARRCTRAAQAMSRVQNEFLESLVEEIGENIDSLMDGGFMLSDMVDRFGPRLAHLNGVMQVLSQLSSTER